MKDGTRYAGRFKKAYARMKQGMTISDIPEWPDPIDRLATAILGVECGDRAASRAVRRLGEAMVDWNEVRASYPSEVRQAIGDRIPNAERRCEELIRALNAVYDRENTVSLDRLKTVGKREARHYFEKLNGVDEYASAAVLLWSLGGHAIPVNDRVLSALRDVDLVHPAADRAEVQAFLERHVPAERAKETCLILEAFGEAPKMLKAARKKVTSNWPSRKSARKKAPKKRRA